MESNQSSNTPDLKRPLATRSKRLRAGAPLGNVPKNKQPSCQPELVGQQFGSVKVISPDLFWLGRRERRFPHALCECVGCGYRAFISLASLRSGLSKGCRDCNQPRLVPKWLYARIHGMKQRCQNPKEKRFPDYGGRGIEFRFESQTIAGLWIVENLGIPENWEWMELDRIDNNGHYEPGNIQWASRRLNMANRRVSKWAPLMHKFTIEHPEIKYSEATLRSLLSSGMSFEDIVARYHLPSCKPKGKYGTSLIADPEIASLAKDF